MLLEILEASLSNFIQKKGSMIWLEIIPPSSSSEIPSSSQILFTPKRNIQLLDMEIQTWDGTFGLSHQNLYIKWWSCSQTEELQMDTGTWMDTLHILTSGSTIKVRHSLSNIISKLTRVLRISLLLNLMRLVERTSIILNKICMIILLKETILHGH